MTAEPTNQTADDFPAESWVLVRVQPSDVPAAVRVRAWLKDGLRRHGIRAIRLTGEVPAVEREIGPENATGAICDQVTD